MKIYEATVESRLDPLQMSRVQVRILPEFKDVDSVLLPWVRPFIYSTMSNNPPELGSLVSVLFLDEYFQIGYWISELHLDVNFNYIDTVATIEQIPEFGTSSYPDVYFKKYINGTIEFHNSTTGDTGFVGKNGSYFILSEDEFTIATGPSKLKVSPDSITQTINALYSIQSESDSYNLKFNAENGDFSTAFTSFAFTGKELNYSVSTVNMDLGIADYTITNKTERVLSNSIESIGGNKTLSISGAYQSSIFGNTSQLHIGDYTVEVTGNPTALPPTLGTITIKHSIAQTKIVISTTSIEIDGGLLPVNVKGSVINLG